MSRLTKKQQEELDGLREQLALATLAAGLDFDRPEPLDESEPGLYLHGWRTVPACVSLHGIDGRPVVREVWKAGNVIYYEDPRGSSAICGFREDGLVELYRSEEEAYQALILDIGKTFGKTLRALMSKAWPNDDPPDTAGKQYTKLREHLTNLPMTWYPDLIRAVVLAAYDKGVFVPGGASEYVKGIEPAT